MVLHKVENEKLIEYSKTPVSREFEIQDFIEKYPQILSDHSFIIGREVKTDYSKSIDLLGLNHKGDTIIIEIKKDQTPRIVIAQILEYAEWISNSVDFDKLNKISKKKHLTGFTSLWKKCESEFGETPEFNVHQQLFIVAEKIDPITEKLARYLRENGIDIFCVELNFYKKDLHIFCNTEMIVGKEKAIIPDSSDDKDMNYNWNYYSERRGWSDEAIIKMKELVNDILELKRREEWNIEEKFNQTYYAIKTRGHIIFTLKAYKGLIQIDLSSLKKKDDPPESSLDWEWYEPKSLWRGNFSLSKIPSIIDIQHLLKKSYNYRNE